LIRIIQLASIDIVQVEEYQLLARREDFGFIIWIVTDPATSFIIIQIRSQHLRRKHHRRYGRFVPLHLRRHHQRRYQNNNNKENDLFTDDN